MTAGNTADCNAITETSPGRDQGSPRSQARHLERREESNLSMTTIPTATPRTRRANGSGTKPKWNPTRKRFEGKVSLPDGKRRSVYGRTEREYEQNRDALLSDVETGRPLTSARYSVAEYLTDWLRSIELNSGLKRGTLRSYELNVRLYLIPALGRHSL